MKIAITEPFPVRKYFQNQRGPVAIAKNLYISFCFNPMHNFIHFLKVQYNKKMTQTSQL